jgi:hypothetical protein
MYPLPCVDLDVESSEGSAVLPAYAAAFPGGGYLPDSGPPLNDNAVTERGEVGSNLAPSRDRSRKQRGDAPDASPAKRRRTNLHPGIGLLSCEPPG